MSIYNNLFCKHLLNMKRVVVRGVTKNNNGILSSKGISIDENGGHGKSKVH